jgi:hypothetical protein
MGLSAGKPEISVPPPRMVVPLATPPWLTIVEDFRESYPKPLRWSA